MLRARFAEDGKLEELDIMFDGVAVHQQIQKATGVRVLACHFEVWGQLQT